jgi:hypothetical protein
MRRALPHVVAQSCAASQAGAVPVAAIGSVRHFARFIKNNESTRGVYTEFDPTDAATLANIKLPFVREDMREDMWKLHKSDPARWTYQEISLRFKMSHARARAILWLMGQREAKMAKNKVLHLSDTWKSIWKLHLENPQEHTPEKIAEALTVDIEEVKTCIANIQEHHNRLENLSSKMEA